MPVERDWQYLSQDLSAADLELAATAGQGFEVFEVGIDGGAANLVAPLSIGGVTLMNFPADAGAANVVPVLYKDTNRNTLFKMVRDKLPDIPTLKVPEGKRLVLSSNGAAGTGYIFYRELSGGDIPAADAPGGPNNLTRLFVSHGKAEWSVAAGATEIHKVDTSLNVSELRDFPFEEDVPAGLQYRMLGFATILGSGSGADISYGGIRMWYQEQSWLKQKEEFADPSLFPYNKDDTEDKVRFFPTPFVFSPHQEVVFEVQASNAGTAAETAQVFVTVLALQEPAGRGG